MALGAPRSSVSLWKEQKGTLPLFPLQFPLAVRTGLDVFCLPFFSPLGELLFISNSFKMFQILFMFL